MFRLNKAICYAGRPLQFGVVYLDENSNQISIAGLTNHFIKIQNQDGTWIEKQAGAGLAWGYQLDQNYLGVYTFTQEETANFKKGTALSVFLKLVYGENIVWQEMKGFLAVFPDKF